ncbi:MAG: hypothetical protein IAE79_00320 [Anaerolinea sp.]|nr:hypothetical protein [Anaerolinea sp.]
MPANEPHELICCAGKRPLRCACCPASPPCLPMPGRGFMRAVAFSVDGRYRVAHAERVTTLWDMATATAVTAVRAENGEIYVTLAHMCEALGLDTQGTGIRFMTIPMSYKQRRN